MIIAAFIAPFVKLLIFLTAPINIPIGKVLDIVLGEEHSMPVFSNEELQHLIKKHAQEELDKLKEFKNSPEMGLSKL